jgi:hypothetical protein
MIRVTVTPRQKEGIYGLLVKKELQLRNDRKGTLRRHGPKKLGDEKWTHKTYAGWIRFQKCLGGVLVAQVQSKTPKDEWQLLLSFIGFLDRHFRGQISSVNLSYELEEQI